VSAGANGDPVGLGLLGLSREVWVAGAVFGDGVQDTTFSARHAYFLVSNFSVMLASLEE